MKRLTVFRIFFTAIVCMIAALAVCVTSEDAMMLTVERPDDTGWESNIISIQPQKEEESEEVEFPETEITDDLPPSPDATETVYVTATGTKYHLAGCSYLRSSANEITIEDAEAKGYTPCSRCFK